MIAYFYVKVNIALIWALVALVIDFSHVKE